jgi:RNA polymerase sigma-70 factor (ECF subfamily)
MANNDRDTTMNSEIDIEAVWHTHRRRLLDIGYRMLGSLADAEDVTSEAYTRLVAADTDAIDDLAGWLITVTGRLCLDRLRSHESSRRAYVGPWLPEPILSAAHPAAVDPADRVTLDDSVRMALLVVLEQLSPAERTSFVLHDLFGMGFEEVAEIVGRSSAACRQLASRARRRIQSDPETPRTSIDRAELEDVAQRFAHACRQGTVEPLLEVLDPNVIGDFDSGGTVPGAPLRALDGAQSVARVLVHSFSEPGFTFTVEDVNGDPGVIVRLHDIIAAVIALGTYDNRVDVIHAIGNPQKLTHLQ